MLDIVCLVVVVSGWCYRCKFAVRIIPDAQHSPESSLPSSILLAQFGEQITVLKIGCFNLGEFVMATTTDREEDVLVSDVVGNFDLDDWVKQGKRGGRLRGPLHGHHCWASASSWWDLCARSAHWLFFVVASRLFRRRRRGMLKQA